MQATPRECAMAGCGNPRNKANDLLCGEHRRLKIETIPSIYPMCATEHCPRRARARSKGAMCAPCRLERGDPTVMCLTPGCGRVRVQQGLCERCLKAGMPGLPPRARLPRRETCKTEGCMLQPGKRGSRCTKHSANRDACLHRGCATTATADGRCEKHRPGSRICRFYRCPDPILMDGLCRFHHEKQNPATCAREDCTNAATVGAYCRIHDVGIDFAAGEWFDWVAVEQLWEGRLADTRLPTVPELNALFDRAERRQATGPQLAMRTGVDERRLHSWRTMLGRIEYGTRSKKSDRLAEMWRAGVPSVSAAATLDMPWSTVRAAYQRLRNAA